MSLAVFGNYAWLNLQVAFMAVALVLLVADHRSSPVRSLRYVAFVIALLLINGLSIFYVAKEMLDLQAAGGLDAGTNQGFIGGTLASLAQLYLYNADRVLAARDVLLYSVLAIVAVSGVWLAARIIRERRVTFSAVLLCILALAGLAPVLEHVLFNTMFPADRAALYFVSLTAVLMAFVADEIASEYPRPRLAISAACVLLTGTMVIHFVRTANVSHTLLWQYDASTKEVMKEIEARVREGSVGSPVSIGVFWPFEPTMNFYRSVWNYTWLERITRDAPTSKTYDYLYCPIGLDLGEARKTYTLVRQYPLSNSELLAGPRTLK
jgi:hypothetical protein